VVGSDNWVYETRHGKIWPRNYALNTVKMAAKQRYVIISGTFNVYGILNYAFPKNILLLLLLLLLITTIITIIIIIIIIII
jgi:hypothetical protein